MERQVWKEELGPILALRKLKKAGIRPNIDEDGGVDWGAFASVDFDRYRPEFDKARYKAEKLCEKLKDVLIMLSIVKDRIPGREKYQVLKQLRLGVMELEDVVDFDMWSLARLWLRARRLRRQIAGLEEASWRRRQRETEKLFRLLG